MADCVESMFSVREKPWHYEMTKDRTKIIQTAPTSADALVYAGLDWEVNPFPVYDKDGRQIPGYYANTRDKDNSVLGIVSGRYKIVQNKDAFDFTDNLLANGMSYETAGSLKNGKTIWLLGKMDKDYQIAGDKVEQYICFTNSHDGSGSIRACMTPIRVVCNNTLNMALRDAKQSWSARHTGDINTKLVEARETLGLASLYMEAMKAKAEELALETYTVVDASRAIKLLQDFDNLKEKQKERAKEQEEQIIACMFAPDLANFFNTKWAFINAISDYVGHSEPTRHTKNYAANNWGKIINGHPMLNKAMALVTD